MQADVARQVQVDEQSDDDDRLFEDREVPDEDDINLTSLNRQFNFPESHCINFGKPLNKPK